MQLHVSTLQGWVPGVAYAIAGIVAAAIFIAKLSKSRKVCKEHNVSCWRLTSRY